MAKVGLTREEWDEVRRLLTVRRDAADWGAEYGDSAQAGVDAARLTDVIDGIGDGTAAILAGPLADDEGAVQAVFRAMCENIEGDYSTDEARTVLAAIDRYLSGNA